MAASRQQDGHAHIGFQYGSRPAVESIIGAWRRGRPLVFFLGAGISVGSGFPSIRPLNGYLAQLLFAFHQGLFDHRFLGIRPAIRRTGDVRPSKLIEMFDWPSPERLAHDMWRWLEKPAVDQQGHPIMDQQGQGRNNFVQQFADFITAKKLLFRDEEDSHPDKKLLFKHEEDSHPETSRTGKGKKRPEHEYRAALEVASNIPSRDWLNRIEQAVFLAELAVRHDEKLAQYAAEILFGRQTERIRRALEQFGRRILDEHDERIAHAIAKPGFPGTRGDSAELLHALEQSLAQQADRIPQSITKPGFPGTRGDWTELLDSLTEGQNDLIDALFVMLGRQRRPALSQVYLAFLTRVLGTQLILTTNFDPLVEQALIAEGMEPAVFDVFRDAVIPHQLLVRGRLAVVKLHGSAYGLRVGERLQVALDETTRSRILAYMPEDALVVVLGFSGWERRMLQVLEEWVQESAPRASRSHENVLWLHQEPICIPFEQLRTRLKRSDEKAASGMRKERILDAGTFLVSVYDRFASTNPVSTVGYRTALRLRVEAPDRRTLNEEWSKGRQHPIHLFCNNKASLTSVKAAKRFLLDPDNKESTLLKLGAGTDASYAMATFASKLELENYTAIWINLEEHHTVEGVVAEIFDRMRTFDPELPTVILPCPADRADWNPQNKSAIDGKQSEERWDKARKRIWDALKRRRYVLCFDHFEAFGRPQTVHHGTPQKTSETTAAERIAQLEIFLSIVFGLRKPREGHPQDAYFAVAVDVPRERHYSKGKRDRGYLWLCALKSCRRLLAKCRPSPLLTKLHPNLENWLPDGVKAWTSDPNRPERLGEWLKELGNSQTSTIYEVTRTLGTLELSDGDAKDSKKSNPRDVLAALSFFRSPRSLGSIRNVLGRHIGSLADVEKGNARPAFEWVDDQIDQLIGLGFAYRFEGETVWLHRTVHETVYKALTESIRETRIAKLIEPREKRSGDGAEIVAVIKNLLAVSFWHRRIARSYYSNIYLPSRDLAAFWEYVCHRVTAVRYLTSAEALLWGECLKNPLAANPLHPDWPARPYRNDASESPLLIEFKEALQSEQESNQAALKERFEFLYQLDLIRPPSLKRLNAQLQASKRDSAPHGDEATPSVGATAFLANLLHANRYIHLQALRLTIERTRDDLLAKLPAESILGWTGQLLEEDIQAIQGDRLMNRVQDANDSPEIQNRHALMRLLLGSAPPRNRDRSKDEQLTAKVKELMPFGATGRGCPMLISAGRLGGTLLNLRSTVTFERRDFETCIEDLWGAFDRRGLDPTHPSSNQSEVARQAFWQPLYQILKELLESEPTVRTVRELRAALSKALEESKRIEPSTDDFKRYAGLLWKPMEADFMQSRGRGGPPKFGNDFASRAARVSQFIRRTATCLSQLGQPKAAKFAIEIAKRTQSKALEVLIGEGRPDEIRDGERVLEEEHLANIRREIGMSMVDIQPWYWFRTREKNRRDETRDEKRDEKTFAETERLSRRLEETARESPASDGNGYFEHRFEGLVFRGRMRALQQRYVESHRLLDRAAAGLNQNVVRQRAPLAIVHLYRAEALTLSADHALTKRRKERKPPNDRPRVSLPEAVRHARALLQRAAEDLHAAERALVGGRQDLTTWIFIDIGKAQVALELLLLDLCCFDKRDLWPDLWSYEIYSATIERLVDGALAALRRALDAIPYRRDISYADRVQPQHYPETRVIELWIELMIACDAVLYQARLKESRVGRRSPEDATNRPDGDPSWENHAKAMLDEVQQLPVFLGLWLEWSRIHRFEQFAKYLDEKHRDGGFSSWITQRRELFKVSSKGRRRKVQKLAREFVDSHLKSLWDRRRHERTHDDSAAEAGHTRTASTEKPGDNSAATATSV